MNERVWSVRDMMSLMELKDRVNFLKNYLNPALYGGFVEPLFPNNLNHPKQKYRLTNKGKVLLMEIYEKSGK